MCIVTDSAPSAPSPYEAWSGAQPAHPSTRWMCPRSPAMRLEHRLHICTSATGPEEANNSAGTSSRPSALRFHNRCLATQ